MKKGVLFFIICFSVLTGFSQNNFSDHNVPIVIQPPANFLVRSDLSKGGINSESNYVKRIDRKMEKLTKKIETAKNTKVAKEAGFEALKLMTQTRIIASSELLSAVQEVFILANNKYSELVQPDDGAKAKAAAIAKAN